MKSRAGAGASKRLALLAAAVGALTLVPGCSWLPTIPPPWSWFGGGKKIGPLPDIKGTATASIALQANAGNAAPGLAPAVTQNSIFAAASDGALMRVSRESGQVMWRINTGVKLAAGPGADGTLVVVATDKGEVLAFDPDGKKLWRTSISSEVLAPPNVAEGIVAVTAGDGRQFALSSADGKIKWVNQRVNPPLTVRNAAGNVVSRGGLFVGTAGGKLLALDLATGSVGWEGNVSTPKGATELERISDVTSLPAVEERQACAAAYQGRLACFELIRGSLNWSRDISSLDGIVIDNRHLYITDDKGAIHALDKSTGASVWKQDKLGARRIGGPQVVGDFLGVVDGEGYLHLLDRNDGALVGRTATDGSPATAQPAAAGVNAVWQSTNGTVYVVGAH